LEDQTRFSPYIKLLLNELYKKQWREAFNALCRPSPFFYIRVNSLKTSRENVIHSLSSRGIEAFEFEPIKEAIYVRIRESNNIPLYNTKVIVDKFTAESVWHGSHVYAPGIVKCRGVKRNEKVTILDKMETPIASGIATMSEREILNLRRGRAVHVSNSRFYAPSLRDCPEYEKGWIYLQSLPAMLTSLVLDPKPDDMIADLNCAPGGKTSHICQLTENRAIVYAMDRNTKKIEATQRTLRRLGCEKVRLVVQDTRYIELDHPNIKVDKCLIDPPCSALGVTPKLYSLTDLINVKALSEYQKQFIKPAAAILKHGGVMTYSVCTLPIEECEEICRYAIEECGLELISQPLKLGSSGLPGYVDNPQYIQRFHPHIHGLGYFIAKFIKL
jgi:predicted RNA-binding protein (TIGR00451 family)